MDEKLNQNLNCAEKRVTPGVRMAVVVIGILIILITIGIGAWNVTHNGIRNYYGYLVSIFLSGLAIYYGVNMVQFEIGRAVKENAEFKNAFEKRKRMDPDMDVDDFSELYAKDKRIEELLNRERINNNSRRTSIRFR